MKQKRITNLLHVLTWIILFSMPFLIIRNEYFDFWSIIRKLILPTSFFIVFYINYFFLIDKFLFNNKPKTYYTYNSFIVIIGAIITHFLYVEVNSHIPYLTNTFREGLFADFLFIIKDTLPLIFIVIVSISLKSNDRWYHSEILKEELKSKTKEAELNNLKNQLNPHFLFNTLNNIYALIDISKERSKTAIIDLSHLLRYVIYENDSKLIPIFKEIGFVKDYVSLMKLRFSDNVSVTEEYDIAGHEDLEQPPLLYISLIENAFKHGTNTSSQSFVKIHISVDDDENILCAVENSYFPKDKGDKSGSGIGIENLRRRLELQCHDRYEYTAKKEESTYKVTLKILKNART